MATPTPSGSPAGVRTCYRHPDTPAGVVCQRCDRPICPRCMNQASVGFHCPDCLAKGKQRTYQGAVALRSAPKLTYALIGVNVAVFVLGIILSGTQAIDGGSDILVRDGGLFELGRLSDGSFVGVAAGQWYRILTSGFLHLGIFHIGINMFALYILGALIERATSWWYMGVIYVSSLVAGSFGALLLRPETPTAGASGAIYGLFGALLIFGRQRGMSITQSPVLGILVLNLVFTFAVPGISIGGHLGGLAGGLLASLAIFELKAPESLRVMAGIGVGAVAFVGCLLVSPTVV